jgi:hypothetical protein
VRTMRASRLGPRRLQLGTPPRLSRHLQRTTHRRANRLAPPRRDPTTGGLAPLPRRSWLV